MKLYSAADVYPFWKYFHFLPPARHREHKKRHERKMFHFISPRIISYFPARKKEEMPRNNNWIDEFQRRIHKDPEKRIVSDIDSRISVVFVKFINLWFARKRKIVGSDFLRGTWKPFCTHLNSLARRSIDGAPSTFSFFLLINKFARSLSSL